MEVTLNPTLGQRLASLFRLLVMTAMFTTIGAVGVSIWHAYGEEAKLAIVDLVPRVTSMVTSIMSPRHDQTTAMAMPSTDVTGSVQGSADSAAPTAALPGETTQLLQSLARDVAAMGQDIAELKDRMGRLSTGQDQIARDLARIRQPSQRTDVRSAMAAAPPPGPSAAPEARKPVSSSPLSILRPARSP
jgi:hypothetical protein